MNWRATVLVFLALLLLPWAAFAQRHQGSTGYRSAGTWRSPGGSGRPSYFHGTRIYLPPAVSYVSPGSVFVYTRYPRYRVPPATFHYSPYPHYWRYYSPYPSILITTPYYRYAAPGYAPPSIASLSAPAEPRVRSEGQWAPYDPTPQGVVERMLMLAEVKKGDVLYDLGAGDGRIVIAAAKKYGIKAVGFEIDPGLVKLARENVRKQGLEKLVEIRQQDFLNGDLSDASVVTLYLSYDGNQALRSHLTSQLKPGARVVSYTFDMGDWPAKITESYRDAAGDLHMIYLWQIAEPAVHGESHANAPQ